VKFQIAQAKKKRKQRALRRCAFGSGTVKTGLLLIFLLEGISKPLCDAD
jgi:hypothetical protein